MFDLIKMKFSGKTVYGPVLPENSILITANIQSETGFPSSHQLKSYVAYKCRLKLAARAVLSADAGLLVQTVAQKPASGNVVAQALPFEWHQYIGTVAPFP